MYINDADKVVTPDHQYAYSSHDDVIIKIYIVKLDYLGLFTLYNQCLKYKPHTNREAVGVWLCSAAKRPSKRSALVNFKYEYLLLLLTKIGKQITKNSK